MTSAVTGLYGCCSFRVFFGTPPIASLSPSAPKGLEPVARSLDTGRLYSGAVQECLLRWMTRWADVNGVLDAVDR